MEAQSNIKSFLEKFKSHYSTVVRLKIDSDKAKFSELFSGWRTVDSSVLEYEKKSASDYNIFSILKNIANKETITHSPFIADLLNIKGQHKQGDLFYNEFLERLDLGNNIGTYIPENKMFFTVETEKWTGDGSIDILISYRDSHKHFAIAIENKIGAVDQPKQLERYYNYLKKIYKKNFLLIYLSPYGHPPVTPYSINEVLLEELKNTGVLKIISYSVQVRDVLQNTLQKIEADNVRPLAYQYLQIIKNL